MNNLKDYIARKNKEIAIINPGMKLSTNDLSMDTLCKLKNPQNEKQKTNNLFNDILPTNTKQLRIRYKNISFTYNYLRYDSIIEIKDFFIQQYGNVDNTINKNFFTNSGMSAIAALLIGLQTAGIRNVKSIKDIYFETNRLFNMLKIRQKRTFLSDKYVLWLDTISCNHNFNRQLSKSNANIIVIDSTCFLGDELLPIISRIIRENKLCILVRSHTKLDMLGTEYSKLGSISFIIPKILSTTQEALYTSIILNSAEAIGKIGAHVSIAEIPPFWQNKSFKKLSSARFNIIKKNNERFHKCCEQFGVKCILPEHKLFVLFDVDEFKYNKFKENILKTKSAQYISFFGSFGFDFVIADKYVDLNTNKTMLRMAISDYPTKIIEQISQDVTNAF
jgi:hypothetical protein